MIERSVRAIVSYNSFFSCKVVICSCEFVVGHFLAPNFCGNAAPMKWLCMAATWTVVIHGFLAHPKTTIKSKANYECNPKMQSQKTIKKKHKKLWTTSSTKSDSQKTVRSPHQVWKFLSPIQKTWMQMRNVAESVFMQTSATLFAQLKVLVQPVFVEIPERSDIESMFAALKKLLTVWQCFKITHIDYNATTSMSMSKNYSS